MVAAFAAIVWMLPMRAIATLVQETAQRLGFWGFAVYVAAYIVMGVLSIPVWTMPFVAGALFGPIWGTVLSSASCVIAAALCFWIARSLQTTQLSNWLHSSPRLRVLERVVVESNWKIVAAVRLSHFMTFGMQNYAFGLTAIGFWTYLVTTWLVTLPGTALQVYIGHLGFSSMEVWQGESVNWTGWALRISGLVIMACAVGYFGYRMRTAHRQALTEPLNTALAAEGLESAGQSARPWTTFILLTAAVVLSVIAAAVTLQRDVLQRSIERAGGRADSTYRKDVL